MALATALLPTLSRQTAMGRLEDAGKTLGYSTVILFGVMIPASMFMMVMARPVITLVFARGAFGEGSVEMTAAALRYYSLGMVFFSAVRITAPVFYSLKDTRTPVKASVLCMGLNIILNILFTWFFLKTRLEKPLAGLSLASSAAGAVNFMLLRRRLRGRIGPTAAPARVWFALAAGSIAAALALALLRGPTTEAAARGVWHGAGMLALSAATVFGLSLGVFVLFGGARVKDSLAGMVRRGRR